MKINIKQAVSLLRQGHVVGLPTETVYGLAACLNQPKAIENLIHHFNSGMKHQTLLGVTGSGKTFTMAHVIASLNVPTLILAPNKTLAAQLYSEIKELFKTDFFDLDQTKSTIQLDRLDSDILRNYDLIIGCTGKTVLTPQHFQFLKKGTCLVSVSSSDREFSGFNLRKKVENIGIICVMPP